MMEPIIAWFEDKGLSRPKMSWITGAFAWVIAMFMMLSFNLLADFKPFNFGVFDGKNMFGIMDYLVANILLPTNALLLSLFTGWAMSRKNNKRATWVSYW